VEIRLVESFIRGISFATDEIHVMAGQSFGLLLKVEMEEGYSLDSLFVDSEITGDEGLISDDGATYDGDRCYPCVYVSEDAEGTATLTAAVSGEKASASVTVHVHKNAMTFTLPAATKVEKEAFLAVPANIITLQRNQVTVDSRAFADAPNLWQVRLPYTSTITADVLEGSDKAVLVFDSFWASGVEQAVEMGIPFAIEY